MSVYQPRDNSGSVVVVEKVHRNSRRFQVASVRLLQAMQCDRRDELPLWALGAGPRLHFSVAGCESPGFRIPDELWIAPMIR